MKREVRIVNDNGFVEKIIVLDDTQKLPQIEVDGEMIDDPHYVTKKCPNGYYKQQWNFETQEWFEGASQAEIDAIVNQPQPETLEERLAKLDQDIQTNYEMNLENMGVW